MSIPSKPRLASAVLAFTVATVSAVALAADAGKKGPNAGTAPKTQSASVSAVETLELADRLAVYGIKQGDPVAIIQAAKMKKSLPPRAFDGKKSAEGKGAAGADKSSGYDLSADALLARADGLAAGNATLAGLIKDARATKSRGATRGPVLHSDAVQAGNTDIYNVSFRGGEQAIIAVSGDGDTDLDLYVKDENGNTVCSDTDYTDQMACSWTPAWTGPFQIRIQNRGRVYNRYTMAIN